MLRFIFFFLSLFITLNSTAQVFQENYLTFKGHRTTVNAVAFSPDGKILYSGGGKNQIIAWNYSSREVLFETTEEPGIISYLDLNSDGTYLATGSFTNSNVSIYDAQSGEFIQTIATQDNSLAYLSFSKTNPELLATVGVNSNKQMVIKFWDITTGTLSQTFYTATSPVDMEYITEIEFSPNDKYLGASIANSQPGFSVWEVSSGSQVLRTQHLEDMNSVTFSPDGQYLITGGGSTENGVNVWEIPSGSLVHKLLGSPGYVLAVDVSSDGKYIASAGMGSGVIFNLWDLTSGKLVQSVQNSNPTINDVEFSPDGQSLALGLTTYGDAFEVTTTALFQTSGGVMKNDWYELKSNVTRLDITFPKEPTKMEENYKSDTYYSYSRYELSDGSNNYFVRAIEYKSSLDDTKRKNAAKKAAETMANQGLAKGGSIVSEGTFNYQGMEGYEYVVESPDSGWKRKHYQTIFIGNMLYEFRFLSTQLGESASETRFFDSFSIF